MLSNGVDMEISELTGFLQNIINHGYPPKDEFERLNREFPEVIRIMAERMSEQYENDHKESLNKIREAYERVYTAEEKDNNRAIDYLCKLISESNQANTCSKEE